MPSTTGHREHGSARLALVLLAAAAVAAALGHRAWTLLPARLEAVPAIPVDRAVELAVLAVGSVAATWLALSALVGLLYVAAARLGHRWRAGEALLDRAAPALVRRLARSAVGIGVGTGLALAPTAALAADGGETSPDSAPASVVLDLGWQPASDDAPQPAAPAAPAGPGTHVDPGAVTAVTDADTTPLDGTPDADARPDASPDRPSTVSHDVLSAARGTPPDDGTRVVVRGDTLWDIAAAQLGGSPSDADVLREMTRWHDANRDVLGADPDLILPGQVLRTPG